jgi:enoyl-CoA hydratase/carnithine racemase
VVTDNILYELRGRVAYITLNRPRSRNALTFEMYEALFDLTGRVSQDPDIAAMVITGAGEKAFAAGTDISEFRSIKAPEDALAYERRIDRILGALETCPKPIIAAIAGACTGGGAAIAACCDLRIATADMRFGFPIARTLGNCLSNASLRRLTGLVGPARVKDMIFTARLLNAGEAASIGLVTEVVADAEALAARADALAELIAGHAPLTLRATKEGLRRIGAEAAETQDNDLVVMCYTSDDFREGMEAFLTKRPPVWQGR